MDERVPNALIIFALCFAFLLVVAAAISLDLAKGLYLCCFGFVVVGFMEGLVLAHWFRLPKKNCIKWMILANALSTWVGQIALASILVSSMGPWDLYTLRLQLSMYLLIAWLATLMLEWPFTAACFRGLPNWFSKSLIATVVIQTVSCIFLGLFFPFQLLISPFPGHHIVPPEEVPWPAGLVVYFFEEDGQTIRALDTDTGETQVIHAMRRRHHPFGSAVYFGKDPLPPDTEIRLLVAGEYGSPPPASGHDIEEIGILVDTDGIERVARPHDQFDQEESRTRFPFGSDW